MNLHARYFFKFVIFMCFTSIYVQAFDHIELKTHDLKSPWTQYSKSSDRNIERLLAILAKSRSGSKIIQRAQQRANQQGVALSQVIFPGRGSLTDTTLSRRFSAQNPFEIDYITEVKVYINQHLNVADAVLDLAHELIHFTDRSPFNPYVLNFQEAEFVRETVEGKGGEAQAYLAECSVALELFGKGKFKKNGCNQGESLETVIEKFYRVGDYYKQFKQKYRGSVALPVSSDDVSFYSSAYGLPYPLAAIEEYQSIMGKACDNEYKRIAVLEEAVGRSVASGTKKEYYVDHLKKVHSSRCSHH